MRKLIAAFVVFSALFASTNSASAQVRVEVSYSSGNSSSGYSYTSGTSTPGRWEYVAGGSTAECRREPCVVFRPDPYASAGTYRSSESYSRSGYSRSYEYSDRNGGYRVSESYSSGGGYYRYERSYRR